MLGIVNPLISSRNNTIYIDVLLNIHCDIFMCFVIIQSLVNSLIFSHFVRHLLEVNIASIGQIFCVGQDFSYFVSLIVSFFLPRAPLNLNRKAISIWLTTINKCCTMES